MTVIRNDCKICFFVIVKVLANIIHLMPIEAKDEFADIFTKPIYLLGLNNIHSNLRRVLNIICLSLFIFLMENIIYKRWEKKKTRASYKVKKVFGNKQEKKNKRYNISLSLFLYYLA